MASVAAADVTAMGSQARIVLWGAPPFALGDLTGQLAAYERAWTRFDATSELASIPRRRWVPLSLPSYTLLEACHLAWQRSGGLFDASMGRQIAQRGYVSGLREAIARPFTPRRGRWAEVALDPESQSVWLPAGVRLDVGAIGKGYAADLLVAAARTRGAAAAMVDIGGDVAVTGSRGRRWRIGIELDGPAARCFTVAIDGGAVATSSVHRRTWGPAHDRRHHLTDPRTGDQAASNLSSVAVWAEHAWWAESAATALLVGGTAAMGRFPDLHAVGLTDDGEIVGTGALAAAV